MDKIKYYQTVICELLGDYASIKKKPDAKRKIAVGD